MAIGLKLYKTFIHPLTKTIHLNPYLKIGRIDNYSLDDKSVSFYILLYSTKEAKEDLAQPDYLEMQTVSGEAFDRWFTENILNQSNITLRKRIYNYLFNESFDTKIIWEDWNQEEI